MSIVFIVGIVIVLVWAMERYADMRRVAKHDRVLFSFNDIRRKVMRELFSHCDSLLSGGRGTLSHAEKDAAKFLLKSLDGISTHYDRHKTEIFNLRKMRRMVEQDLAHYREIKHEVSAHLSEVPSGKMAELYADFGRTTAEAFVAYTPFIRMEIVFRLLWADLAKPIAQIRREAGGQKFA